MIYLPATHQVSGTQSISASNEAVVSDVEGLILDAVVREWRDLPDSFRPWGVWVRRYSTLTTEQKEPDNSAMPEVVWFLDRRGLKQRSVWEWRRFFIVQCEQPWCKRFWSKEPVAVFGEPHQIGLAAFAPIGGGKYYLETIWAGRYGHGWKLSYEENGRRLSRQELWIS